MNITEIKDIHIGQCADLLTLAYSRPPWNYQWTADRAGIYLAELYNSSGFIGFGVKEGEKLVAAMFGHVKSWWIDDLLMIDELFVSPAHQGKGYGQFLLDTAEKYCRKKNISNINLITHRFMPAMSFYEKNNFFQADQYVLMFKEFSDEPDKNTL